MDDREAARRELCASTVTLYGQPATIAGALQPFAVVRRLDGKGGAVEFAWSTVARIVAAGGAFCS